MGVLLFRYYSAIAGGVRVGCKVALGVIGEGHDWVNIWVSFIVSGGMGLACY